MKSYIESVFGTDLRSLAALRVGCALIVLLDLLQRSTDLTAHYTDYGVTPRSLVIEHSNRWAISFHYMSGVWQWQAVLFIIAGIAAGALFLGYRTRLASIFTWVLCVSLITRNPYVGYGADVFLRTVLFWGIFLPWGAVYSIDAAWRDHTSASARFVSVGTAAYVIQIVSVYLFSAMLKSGTEWWSEGSAIYYALNIDYLATPLGKALQQFPYFLLKLTTWTVLLLETIAPLLLLFPGKKRWGRLGGVICIVALHLMISSVLFVGIFPLIGIAAMLFFLPSEFWNFLEQKFARAYQTGIKIYYDDDCGFCLRMMRSIKMFFLLPEAAIAGAQTVPEIECEMRQHNSWVVLDTGGRRHFGYEGIVVVAGASPVLRPFVPLLRLALMRWCGERIYRYLAIHRQMTCDLANRQSPSGDGLSISGLALNVTLVILIGYTLVLNLSTVKGLGIRLPERSQVVSVATGLDQAWNMFAPFPAKDDGWYVIPGKLRNDTTVDLFRAGQPVSFNKPSYGALEFKNHRWVKFMESLRARPLLQPGYARYLCREWNRRHKGAERLEELEIIYVLEFTQPAPEYSPIQKQSKYHSKCDD